MNKHRNIIIGVLAVAVVLVAIIVVINNFYNHFYPQPHFEIETLPEEYRPIIDDYASVVEFRLSIPFETQWSLGKFPEISEVLSEQIYNDQEKMGMQYRWSNMIVDMTDHIKEPKLEFYGYILKDLNGDGILELIWVSSDYGTVFAIFTIHNGTAKLVDAYWPRSQAVILDSGEIYTLASGGAIAFEYALNRLDADEESGLKTVYCFGCDAGQYYESVNGEKISISKDRFDEILTEHPFEFGESWAENELHQIHGK